MTKPKPITDPLSPFLWAQRKEPSIFAKDGRFVGRYKAPTSAKSITITNKPMRVFSKA